MFNSVQLIGRLSVDPVSDAFAARSTVTVRLAVANAAGFDGLERPEIVPVAAEGPLGEEILDCLVKGALVAVEGQLRTRKDQLVVFASRVSRLDRPATLPRTG